MRNLKTKPVPQFRTQYTQADSNDANIYLGRKQRIMMTTPFVNKRQLHFALILITL